MSGIYLAQWRVQIFRKHRVYILEKKQMYGEKLFYSVINAVVEVYPKKYGTSVENMICSIWKVGESFTVE